MNILKSYIREGEHQTQDFKFRVDDAKKIARTLAAFANTDGGRLLIGVKDNGKVVGVNPEEEFHVIQGAATLYCKPELDVKTQIMQDEHKLVLEVTVAEVENKPIKALDDNGNWKTYVRREDHTLLASKILIGVWKKMRNKTSTPQTFDKDEQLILNTIKEAGSITLSKLYRSTQLKKSYIDKLLILFITWEVVQMKITPSGTFFSVGEEIEE
ncbi:AlbA family DNA-binding domain-containing protein [Brumimicrobium aurantiacum]|uniref:AlbA family DNA-binding domain-containing protein n=1 Tax=Brumimicrobium aurantiacum TaxID=1737063 RepID=UPI001402B05C|nr:ATP-binding protein [Brumimicrobium aurantiacum]